MKTALKSTLASVIGGWLNEIDDHDQRPPGLACDDLSELMTEAAAAVYDASHAGSMKGANDPASCGVDVS